MSLFVKVLGFLTTLKILTLITEFLLLFFFLQTMDKEFKKWMKWYGKKHGEYTVSVVFLTVLSF